MDLGIYERRSFIYLRHVLYLTGDNEKSGKKPSELREVLPLNGVRLS